MPTSSFVPRAERVWKLLVGLNHAPDALLLMARHGFGEEDRREAEGGAEQGHPGRHQILRLASTTAPTIAARRSTEVISKGTR